MVPMNFTQSKHAMEMNAAGKMTEEMRTSRMLLIGYILLSCLVLTACSNDDDPEVRTPTPTENKASMITDKDKLAMIYSLTDLEGDKGRIYEMNYTVDYKLDDALNANISSTNTLTMFVAQHLMDVLPSSKSLSLTFDAGCSAFAVPDKSAGRHLMGRNFDFNHRDPQTQERIMIPVIVVHTAPQGGKKSVSFVDGQFVNYKSGFYTDGTSDLSMLMALPYLLLDGINEDGFAICVLKLDGPYTQQQEEGKKKIFTTVAMRMLLDKASTVKEAVQLLEKYNMCSDKVEASYHFFMADATGDFAIVEYTNPDTELNPNRMEVLTGKDAYRFVTNFYVSPTMADTEHGINHSEHGMNRYQILKEKLEGYGFNLNIQQGKELLRDVAQGPESSTLSTGFTQWSELFDLTRKRVTLSILREFDKSFEFGIE